MQLFRVQDMELPDPASNPSSSIVAGETQASCWTSLSFSFLFHKMGMLEVGWRGVGENKKGHVTVLSKPLHSGGMRLCLREGGSAAYWAVTYFKWGQLEDQLNLKWLPHEVIEP